MEDEDDVWVPGAEAEALTVKQAAEVIGVTDDAIRKMLQDGKLKGPKTEKTLDGWRIDAPTLAVELQRRRTAEDTPPQAEFGEGEPATPRGVSGRKLSPETEARYYKAKREAAHCVAIDARVVALEARRSELDVAAVNDKGLRRFLLVYDACLLLRGMWEAQAVESACAIIHTPSDF